MGVFITEGITAISHSVINPLRPCYKQSSSREHRDVSENSAPTHPWENTPTLTIWKKNPFFQFKKKKQNQTQPQNTNAVTAAGWIHHFRDTPSIPHADTPAVPHGELRAADREASGARLRRCHPEDRLLPTARSVSHL